VAGGIAFVAAILGIIALGLILTGIACAVLFAFRERNGRHPETGPGGERAASGSGQRKQRHIAHDGGGI
jgi:hypothetical protein